MEKLASLFIFSSVIAIFSRSIKISSFLFFSSIEGTCLQALSKMFFTIEIFFPPFKIIREKLYFHIFKRDFANWKGNCLALFSFFASIERNMLASFNWREIISSLRKVGGESFRNGWIEIWKDFHGRKLLERVGETGLTRGLDGEGYRWKLALSGLFVLLERVVVPAWCWYNQVAIIDVH